MTSKEAPMNDDKLPPALATGDAIPPSTPATPSAPPAAPEPAEPTEAPTAPATPEAKAAAAKALEAKHADAKAHHVAISAARERVRANGPRRR